MSARGLTPKQQRFVEEYLIDLNATQAAIRAGYSVRTARSIGDENLSKPDIATAIAAAKAERSKRTKITADQIVQQLSDIVTSDLNELVQYRRGACRYCHGTEFRYQRTAGERDREHAEWVERRAELTAAGKKIPPHLRRFDELGGIGYSRKNAPHPDCPECFGDGDGKLYVPDTRHIPAALRSVYHGVQIGKDGLKVLIADPMKARELLMRHMGMLNDKLELLKPTARVKDFTGRKRKADGE